MRTVSQPRLILSPCGSSILTNRCGEEIRALLSRHANARTTDTIPPDDLAVLRRHIKRRDSEIARLSADAIQAMSAELNAIVQIYGGRLEGHGQDQHVLLCTDTWIGEEAAQIVKAWLERQGLAVQLDRRPGMQTLSPSDFQMAMAELVRWCHETLPGYRDNGYKVVFNLTGGFKSVIGFLQTLGMFYADECVYIFESGSTLLSIPHLPVQLAAEGEVREHLKTFRRLSLGLSVSRDALKKISSTLWFGIDGETALSPWGELVWSQTRTAIYEKELLQPVTPRVEFASGFHESARGITGDRLALLNEKIDRLAVYIENGMEKNDSSLDFKQLKGNPCPPSTHEIDVWTGKGAKRLFGHFTDYRKRTFVLDKVGGHL